MDEVYLNFVQKYKHNAQQSSAHFAECVCII